MGKDANVAGKVTGSLLRTWVVFVDYRMSSLQERVEVAYCKVVLVNEVLVSLEFDGFAIVSPFPFFVIPCGSLELPSYLNEPMVQHQERGNPHGEHTWFHSIEESRSFGSIYLRSKSATV